jgi:hypothetical protein
MAAVRRENRLVGGAIALLLTSLPAHAQTRPDFSGVWVLADPGSSPMCARSFTATQNANMLSLEFPEGPIETRDSVPEVTTNPLRRVQYNFNGTDTPRDLTSSASARARCAADHVDRYGRRIGRARGMEWGPTDCGHSPHV